MYNTLKNQLLSFSTLTINKKMQFLSNFQFQFSDHNGSEYTQLCKTVVDIKSCSTTHRNDARKTSTPIRTTLEPDAKPQRQRPTNLVIQSIKK